MATKHSDLRCYEQAAGYWLGDFLSVIKAALSAWDCEVSARDAIYARCRTVAATGSTKSSHTTYRKRHEDWLLAQSQWEDEDEDYGDD